MNEEEYNQLVKMANEVHRNTMLMEHFYLPIPDEWLQWLEEDEDPGN